MREATALKLVIAIMVLLVSAAYVGLTSVDASEELLTATVILITCVGAYVLSRVVMHYPSPEERQR